MNAAMNEACLALAKAADDMTWIYHVHKETPLYKTGDKVWLIGHNITTSQLMKKLDHKLLSPFMVEEVILQNT